MARTVSFIIIDFFMVAGEDSISITKGWA